MLIYSKIERLTGIKHSSLLGYLQDKKEMKCCKYGYCFLPFDRILMLRKVFILFSKQYIFVFKVPNGMINVYRESVCFILSVAVPWHRAKWQATERHSSECVLHLVHNFALAIWHRDKINRLLGCIQKHFIFCNLQLNTKSYRAFPWQALYHSIMQPSSLISLFIRDKEN